MSHMPSGTPILSLLLQIERLAFLFASRGQQGKLLPYAAMHSICSARGPRMQQLCSVLGLVGECVVTFLETLNASC